MHHGDVAAHLGKVASRWRKVVRVPIATMSERTSSFQKGFDPYTTRSVARNLGIQKEDADVEAGLVSLEILFGISQVESIVKPHAIKPCYPQS